MFHRRWALLVIGALFISGSTLVVISQASTPLAPHLHLQRGTFDAHAAGQAAPTPELAAPAPGGYLIIQFVGPITMEDRAALEKTGVTVLEYLPDFAYLVRGTSDQLSAATQLPQVYASTPFMVADKFAPALLHAFARGQAFTSRVRIVGWPDDTGQLDRDLLGLAVSREVNANADVLIQIARLPAVRWIEPVSRPHLLNDAARGILHVDQVWHSASLFGTGQLVAVADSGLDTGDFATLTPDFAGRISATHVLSTGANWDDNFGHGTHVAGSIAGAGVQSGANPAQHQYTGSFAGVAPEANLVIQAFEADANGNISGLDPDYYPLFAQAYADGARIHSDSWGDLTGPITDTAAAYGGYPYGSQRTDQFIWEHPDMAIFFAAGNSGEDGTPIFPGFCTGGDGVIDPDSLLAPGTAKNVITVGASENYRTSGGLSGFPWLLFSFCFGAPPIATDLPSNNPNGMAAFSSRGPVDDGRAKPDIVAPGTNIISNKSHVPGASMLWGQYENNPDYVYSGGTSMATPLTAGAGALVRQWLVNQAVVTPTAALLKAVMINTTHDIAPGQYGVGAMQEVPLARPNSVAGWGRTDVGFMTTPAPYQLWFDDHTSGLSTSQIVTYTHSVSRPLQVLASAQPLRVMLAWSDPPASLAAATQLVNDLDLVVMGPDGTSYRGNNDPTGDRKNNVEGVIIDNPPLGAYQIGVSAYNVPISVQPYALVVSGALITPTADVSITKSVTPTSVMPGQAITYSLRYVNAGSDIASGVIITDRVPDTLIGVSYTSTGTPITSTGNLSFTWLAADLMPGAGGIITLTGIVSPTLAAGAAFTNTAIITLTGTDTDSTNNASSASVIVVQTRSIYLPLLFRTP